MYVTTREINAKGIIFPKGSRLSDVYEGGPDETFHAFVYHKGMRKKVLLKCEDFAPASSVQ